MAHFNFNHMMNDGANNMVLKAGFFTFQTPSVFIAG